MKRDVYDDLLKWKESPYRKPLILNGARQVGKTFLLTEFGKTEYENLVVLNCDKDKRISDIFSKGYQTKRIINDIEVLSGSRINPDNTLIFIDEVGEVPEAIAALKYFCEDSPEFHIAVAGSLLGLSIHKGVSFPVGKVDTISLYPLSFPEFVRAVQGEQAYSYVKEINLQDTSTTRSIYEDLLRQYYFTGGMPEVVQGFIDERGSEELRNIQKRILADYALDISKHADTSILGRIHQVWNSIPQQLAKRNKKFKYADIQKGGRAKDFELAIEWLIDAGIIHKIRRVNKPGIPLKFYEDLSAFKLFLLDHGLLGAMVDAPISEILLKENVFEEYKGTFTEQFVLEQLICKYGKNVYYYDSEKSKLELDFLIQKDNYLVPIEVKAEENLRSKSLRQFHMDYPNSKPIRLSMSNYREQEWMTNIPLYYTHRV